VQDLVESAARWGTLALLAIAFGLGFGEGAIGLDLIIPGEVGMVFAGAAAEEADIFLPFVIIAGASGAFAGDCVGYFIGRRFLSRSERLQRRYGDTLERAHAFFGKRGGWAVFAARFIGALRAIVPVVAGAARMDFPRFALFDIPAALLWTTLVAGLGYYAGDDIADAVDRVGVWVSLAGVALLILVVLIFRSKARRRGR